jgi:hypothetical protein
LTTPDQPFDSFAAAGDGTPVERKTDASSLDPPIRI